MYIIAEAGINHNGNIDLAKELIYGAKKAGANAVKFQAAIPELVCIENSPLAKYQKENASKYNNQFEMIKSLFHSGPYDPLSNLKNDSLSAQSLEGHTAK